MLRPAIAPLLATIEKTCRAAGYTLVLMAAEETLQGQREALDFLESRGLDGLIFSGTAEYDPALNTLLEELKIPVVLLDRDPTDSLDAVTVDHAHAIEASVKHLHALGHRDIGLLTVPTNLLPGRERIDAFRQSLEACKLNFREQWFSAECVDDRTTFQQASYMLSKERPTALIAGGSSLLPSVLRAARQKRLLIGSDLSVVAGCESELAELANPAVTVTRWSIEEWGRIAAEMLLQRIRSPHIKGGRHVLLPTELVVRESTGAPRSAGVRGRRSS